MEIAAVLVSTVLIWIVIWLVGTIALAVTAYMTFSSIFRAYFVEKKRHMLQILAAHGSSELPIPTTHRGGVQ